MTTQNITTLVDKYINDLQRDGDTIKAYRLDLEKFVRSFGENTPADLNKDNLKTYLDALTTRTGKRVSVSTQNRHYATLSCFFNYLINNEQLESNPLKSVERRKPNKDMGEASNKDTIRYLDKSMIQQIMECAKSVREQFLFDLLYSSGLRISEALDLNIQDIRNGVIHVRHGKGNAARVTYLSKHTEKLLSKYLDIRVPERALDGSMIGENEGALFTTNNGTRMGYHRANQLFKQATKGLKNPDGTVLTVHQLRHTFCTERVGYIDIRVLQKLAGHSDIRTTLRYAKVADGVAREQFQRFEERQMDERGRFRLPTIEDFQSV